MNRTIPNDLVDRGANVLKCGANVDKKIVNAEEKPFITAM